MPADRTQGFAGASFSPSLRQDLDGGLTWDGAAWMRLRAPGLFPPRPPLSDLRVVIDNSEGSRHSWIIRELSKPVRSTRSVHSMSHFIMYCPRLLPVPVTLRSAIPLATVGKGPHAPQGSESIIHPWHHASIELRGGGRAVRSRPPLAALYLRVCWLSWMRRGGLGRRRMVSLR